MGQLYVFDVIRWLGGALLMLAALYGVVCAGLYGLQRRIVFANAGTRPDPVAFGVTGVEVLEVRTAAGLVLNAWFRPPPSGPSVAGGRVALFLHGNAGTIGHRAGRIAPFAAAGWGVLLLEWRGYGGNLRRV